MFDPHHNKMVLLTGYDPVIRVPQTRVLPLHQSSIILEGKIGFEPTFLGFADRAVASPAHFPNNGA